MRVTKRALVAGARSARRRLRHAGAEGHAPAARGRSGDHDALAGPCGRDRAGHGGRCSSAAERRRALGDRSARGALALALAVLAASSCCAAGSWRRSPAWPPTPSASPAATWTSRPSARARARSPRSARRCGGWPPASRALARAPRPSASAASSSARSRTTCGRRCSPCAARSRRSSTASATPTTCARARQGAHLDRLVGDLFMFCRPSTRRAQAGEPVDLAEIARAAADTVDRARSGSSSWPRPSRSTAIRALQRVLVNLLDNAVRHARTEVELRVAGRGASRSATTARASRPTTCRSCSSRCSAPTGRAHGDRRRRPRAGDRAAADHAHGGEVEAANSRRRRAGHGHAPGLTRLPGSQYGR